MTVNGRKVRLDWNTFLLRCNQIWLQDTNDNLEEDLIRRKQNIATLAKEIYKMLVTPPFVVRKPTGIDFIQHQLQSQFRDHVKAKRRSAAILRSKENPSSDSAADTSASST
jgi:hypothetical protein